MNNNKIVYKLLNWEYWPTFMFYLPNIPYAFYLAIKARSLVFYTAVNPALKNSGNGTESKYKTTLLIPKKYRPKTILVIPTDDFDSILNKLKATKITFPLIIKPDIGFRGMLVKKIYSEVELKEYLKKYPINSILQEFISLKNECGVFYHRLPNKKNGTITSITLKKFPIVIADGITTLSKLILMDKRAKVYYNLFEEIHKEKMNLIPEKGREILLTNIGNHSKGTEFIDGNNLITKKLTNKINSIAKQIDGWFYGRLDIKYDSFEKLEKGIDFKILEINGIISEPTHIFDAKKHSYFDAVKAIRNHWKILYDIAIINHKNDSVKYANTRTFISEVLKLRSYIKFVKKLNLQ